MKKNAIAIPIILIMTFPLYGCGSVHTLAMTGVGFGGFEYEPPKWYQNKQYENEKKAYESSLTDLHKAVLKNDISSVKKTLPEHPNEINNESGTFWDSQNNDIEMPHGTPLQMALSAVDNINPEIVNFLINNKGKISYPENPLSLYFSTTGLEHPDAKVVKILLNSGSEAFVPDLSKNQTIYDTPFGDVIGTGEPPLFSHPELIDLFLDMHKLNPDSDLAREYLTASIHNVEMFKKLVNYGVSVKKVPDIFDIAEKEKKGDTLRWLKKHYLQ